MDMLEKQAMEQAGFLSEVKHGQVGKAALMY